MTALHLRPVGYTRWCRYRWARAGVRITTVCGAAITQGEPLELADDPPVKDRCTVCEATAADSARPAVDAVAAWDRWWAESRPADLEDDALGPDTEAIRAVLDTEHEDLLGDEPSAFDHLDDLREEETG